MRLRHGDKREGMENEGEPDGEPNGEPDSVAGGDESCPKDCNAVEALRKKLTGLIENASKLQKDIQANNETIRNQHRTIEQMQKGIQKLTEKSAK